MLFIIRPKLYLIAILFALSQQLFAQKSYPTGYFQSPLEFRLLLAGTFGEIRANHFHSGIDIKTNGAEGAAVHAIADGYVSRIKVSAYGFGKVIYVTHPNGYVSVYGHLSRYNTAIGSFVRNEQYRRESFEIELFPSAGALPVKKGEIIAFSGNSGSSGGPHLHFEIRDGGSEKPINPLLFGYEVKDLVRPKITLLKIYAEDENARINGKSLDVSYPVEGWGEEHRLNVTQPIRLSGNISFAIQASDQQNDTDNKNGPYSISLYIDKEPVFQQRMETFSFDESRYVNSLLDYSEYMKSGVRLERTRVDPGNRLSIYDKAGNHGVFLFDDTLQHVITYEVKDVAGNTALLTFKVKSEKFKIKPVESANSISQIPDSKFQFSNFNYNTPNHFDNGSVILDAPKGVFYDSFVFKYDSTRRIAGTYSAVHQIHNKYTPVHDYITLSIKPVNLPDQLKDKAVIVKIKDDGKSYTSAGGKWENTGYITTKIREFGNYSVSVDTIAPKITAVQPEIYTKMAGQKNIRLIISDELSGIAGYRATLNGKWILMEYDAKNDRLTYTVDEYLIHGRNTLMVEVTDGKNNRAIFGATLIN
jgi:hypothetical protein